MNSPLLSTLLSVAVSSFIAVIGWAIAFGAMRAEVKNLKEDITKMSDRMADVSESRLERLEHEIEILRNWRHGVENEIVSEVIQARIERKRRMTE